MKKAVDRKKSKQKEIKIISFIYLKKRKNKKQYKQFGHKKFTVRRRVRLNPVERSRR